MIDIANHDHLGRTVDYSPKQTKRNGFDGEMRKGTIVSITTEHNNPARVSIRDNEDKGIYTTMTGIDLMGVFLL